MALDKLLKRHFWAVIMALVAIAAFFDAQGIMQVVGASLGADAKQLAIPPLGNHGVPGASSTPWLPPRSQRSRARRPST
jgi:hypothetical protein